MNDFKIVKLKIKARAIDDIELPDYAGSVFRVTFCKAFKEVTCLNSTQNCVNCTQKSECLYIKIFETEFPEEAKFIKRFQKPPKPYIIDPPAMNLTRFNKGKDINFGLTLIGSAIKFTPYFIISFKEMEKIGIGKNNGKISITDVLVYSLKEASYKSILKYKQDKQQLIYDLSNNSLDDAYSESAKISIKQIKLNFITPINIVSNKSSKHNLEFHSLFGRLISRINALSLLYCGKELTDKHYDLIAKAKEIETKENCTSWYQFRSAGKANAKKLPGGYLGDISYEGDLSEFLPYLHIGELVHVGKNTTLGFGKYQLIESFN